MNWPGVEAAGLSGVTARPGPPGRGYYGAVGGTLRGRACASGVGSAGVAGLGALRGPMVFPTLVFQGSQGLDAISRYNHVARGTASRMRLLSSCASFTLFPTAPSPSRTLRTQMLSEST